MTFFIWVISNAQECTLVCLSLHVLHPFAGAQKNNMSLTHMERQCAVGFWLKGKLVRLLSLGAGRHFEPQSNRRTCSQMMRMIARRVAAKMVAGVRAKTAKEAEEMCASGQCAAAVVILQRAIYLGNLPSRAHYACMLITGREGIAQDRKAAFELLKDGARLGCPPV
jgi:TPR repeat protein